MPNDVDTRDLGALSGAVYFSVGRGTEGGGASYRLSVAGVTYGDWGQVSEVAANSGYTIGAIQVDFGQRGTWPVGAIEGRRLQPGEITYVDAVVARASAYAQQHRLPFTEDLEKLRSDLLTHGNGQRGRTSISFIDNNTRDSITAWASSDEGKRWIHRNMDLPQVRGATEQAMAIVDRSGSNISEDTRFQAISILAKTANQAPGHLGRLEKVLQDGGDYNDLLTEAKEIKANPRHSYFDGPKAAEIAERYAAAYAEPTRRDALDRAQSKVSSPNFDPSTESSDLDVQAALSAIGQRVRAQAQRDPTVVQLQRNLNDLGARDTRGQPLVDDGNRGGPDSRTNEAIAAFQRQFGLEDNQMSNAQLLAATQIALSTRRALHPEQALRDILPESARSPQMIDGMPDYLVPGRRAPAPERTVASPQPAETATSRPLSTAETLQPGDRGGAVLALQQHLRLIGATDRNGQALKPDRDYGDRTREAVEQFQLWTGRETTGIADPGTLTALQEHAQFAARQQAQGVVRADSLADNLKPATPDLADAANLRTPEERNALQNPAAFEQGRSIASLQSGLIELGYQRSISQPLAVNGTFDDATRQAVAAFQAKHDLPVTSSFDTATQQALQQALLAQQASEQRQAEDMVREKKPAENQQVRQEGVMRREQDPMREAPDSLAASPLQMSKFSSVQFPSAVRDLRQALCDRLEQQGQLAGLSDDRLSQMAGQMHSQGMQADGRWAAMVHNGTFHAQHQDIAKCGSRVNLDLSQPEPSAENTLQQVAQFDRQRALDAQAYQEQRQREQTDSARVQMQ